MQKLFTTPFRSHNSTSWSTKASRLLGIPFLTDSCKHLLISTKKKGSSYRDISINSNPLRTTFRNLFHNKMPKHCKSNINNIATVSDKKRIEIEPPWLQLEVPYRLLNNMRGEKYNVPLFRDSIRSLENQGIRNWVHSIPEDFHQIASR